MERNYHLLCSAAMVVAVRYIDLSRLRAAGGADDPKRKAAGKTVTGYF